MGEDSLVGREYKMSELSGGKDVVGPFFKIRQQDVISGRDDCAFVDAADQLNHNLFASVVIDDLELSDVVVPLHDSQKLEQDLGDGLQEDLLFAFAFSIDDASECVSKDIDLDHWLNY